MKSAGVPQSGPLCYATARSMGLRARVRFLACLYAAIAKRGPRVLIIAASVYVHRAERAHHNIYIVRCPY